MDEFLFKQIKNSLNKQCYIMNDSWLADGIEYYLNDHENPTEEEIMTFVINQWVLGDLRDINNENGCLPKNLKNQKCVILRGKYILQMDKIYDISTSKYKQLEKIRNISSENVDATENENLSNEDKFQAWEPKSKRMLQLFLTDGIQDVLAIEYKPIRFLKDNLYPGFKLMIKGPVTCRKGVILLEETNLSEIGGEVDTLLIINAVENVFARALNLEENPDPYNDNNKQIQNTQSTQNSHQMQDDFDIDSEVIAQIDKQIQQKNSNSNTNLNTSSIITTEPNQISKFNNKYQKQNNSAIKYTQDSTKFKTKNQLININEASNVNTNKLQKSINNYNINNKNPNFADEDDSFLEKVDEKAFENFTMESINSMHQKPTKNKPLGTSKTIQNQKNDFPTEDEMCDLIKEQSQFLDTKVQNESSQIKSDLSNKISNKFIENNSKSSLESEKSNQKNIQSKENTNNKNLSSWKLPSPLNLPINVKPSTSNARDFPDDDFDLNDFDIKTNDFKTNTFILKNTNDKVKNSHSQISNSLKNLSNETKHTKYNELENLEVEFNNEFDVEFECKMNINKLCSQEDTKNILKSKIEEKTFNIKSENIRDNSSSELTGIKRSANTMSPQIGAPQKIRCLQNNSKVNSKNSESISETTLLREDAPKFLDCICDVLKEPVPDGGTRTVVRGKVVNIIKLNLLKRETGSYFHLEGTITDDTANLDVVFSSEVLEKIIGYSPQEFSQKRKQSKTDSKIKDQLREDLKKAQQTLRIMDALMEIELKKNEKALIMNTLKLTKEQKVQIEKRVKLLKI